MCPLRSSYSAGTVSSRRSGSRPTSSGAGMSGAALTGGIRSTAAPAGDAHDDHPQLPDRGATDLLAGDGVVGVLERLGDLDHRVDEQAGEDVEVLGRPAGESGEAREVRRELGGDEADLGAAGVAQDADAA